MRFRRAAQTAGPPPRKTVEYGTGVVVSDDGAIVADRQITDGCLTVAIAGLRQCRPRRRGQGARSRAAAHLWRARAEGAQSRQRRHQDGARPHRHCRSAEPGRRRRGEQRQGVGGPDRRPPRCRAVACPGARFLRRGGTRWRRQVRRHRAAEAGVNWPAPPNGVPAAQAVLVTADTVRDFLKANGVNAAGGSSGCESVGRARDLREEVGPALVPDAVQRVSGAPQRAGTHIAELGSVLKPLVVGDAE